MELTTHRFYEVVPPNLRHNQYQHSGPVQDFQQTSKSETKPDPQDPPALLFFHSIPQPNRRSVYDGMHFQNSAESTNGHFHNRQQRHSREVDQRGPPAALGRLQEQIYAACNSSHDGLFNGNRVNETPFPKLEHGIAPPSTTLISTYGSVAGSHDDRPRKAPRTVNVSVHD